MSTVSSFRCSKQNHSNISFGHKKPKRVATDSEMGRLQKAIESLNKAKTAQTESLYILHITEAFRALRNIARERIL